MQTNAPGAAKLKHVALIVEMGFSAAQDMVRGLADYVQEHEPWAIYLKPYGANAPANWFEIGTVMESWSTPRVSKSRRCRNVSCR